jgi:hypothetical protein
LDAVLVLIDVICPYAPPAAKDSPTRVPSITPTIVPAAVPLAASPLSVYAAAYASPYVVIDDVVVPASPLEREVAVDVDNPSTVMDSLPD